MRQRKSLARASALFVVSLMAAGATRAQDAPIEVEGWDVSLLDARIAEAVEGANRPGAGAGAGDKRAAAAAYLARANVFFDAGRPGLYRLALGDFRRVLRFQPDNAEAREKAEMLTSIYESLLRPVPPNGGEADAYNDPRLRYKFKPEPVKLPPDGESATLSGPPIPAGAVYVYEISRRANQRLGLSLRADDGAQFGIFRVNAGGLLPVVLGATKWDLAAPEAATYLVRVSTTKADYKLEVAVTAR